MAQTGSEPVAAEADPLSSAVYKSIVVNKVVTLAADKDNITCVQYSANGEHLVCGDADGRMQILVADTGVSARPVKHYKHGSNAVMSIRFHPVKSNYFLAATANGVIQGCDVDTGASQCCATETENVIHCLDISQTGERVITVGKDLKVRLYDEVSMQIVRTMEGYTNTAAPDEALVGHALRVFGLKCHPEYEHLFVTGGWDNHLKLWDWRTSEGVVSIIHGPHLCGDSIDIRGSYIVSGSWVKHNSIQLWDLRTNDLVRDLKFHHGGDGEYLYCTKFVNDTTILAGGSGTNSAQAINIDTGELVAEVKMGHAVQSLHSALNGRKFCIAGASTRIKLCSFLE